ncbi:MAG: tyrosine-protein phosphatase [Firmicutes bacterium]|nr:tyrosine-protein phosphatase [Bacillota bacterium]
MKQSINTPSIKNARELGGYVNKNGKKIKMGRLLRTGKLANASQEDLDCLANVYHVKKVFDFRGKDERDREPDLAIEGAKNYWINIIDEFLMNAAKREEEQNMFESFMYFIKSGFMRNMYVDIVKSDFSQKAYHTFLKEVIDCEDGAILWHCSAGKDRTGLAALFLLTILDFDLEQVYEDYILTNEYVKDLIEVRVQQFLAMGCPEKYIEDLRCIEGVNLDYFKAGIVAVEENYGSVREFIINQLGISEEEITLLKNRYLE